jgi:nitrous oxidase accessory protein NosD
VVTNNIGIYLYITRDCQIRNNNIIRNKGGIFGTGERSTQFYYCYNTTVTGNYISDNDVGIGFAFNRDGMISGNIITNNSIGFGSYICTDNIICIGNNISNNNVGLNSIHGLTVIKNNFINNTQHVKLRGFHSFLLNIYNSTLKRNYWDKPRKLPYPIPVRIGFRGLIPWFPQFDWNPAQEPYDI